MIDTNNLPNFIEIHDGDDHLTIARACVSAAFNHHPVVDMRTQESKAEWQSGGARNPYGSTKKFNASRSRMIWLSKYTWLDEEGREVSESQTRNLGRNMLKRVARELSRKHGLSYSQSKRLLMAHMEQQEANQ